MRGDTLFFSEKTPCFPLINTIFSKNLCCCLIEKRQKKYHYKTAVLYAFFRGNFRVKWRFVGLETFFAEIKNTGTVFLQTIPVLILAVFRLIKLSFLVGQFQFWNRRWQKVNYFIMLATSSAKLSSLFSRPSPFSKRTNLVRTNLPPNSLATFSTYFATVSSSSLIKGCSNRQTSL